jgi:hypothetical protein
MTSQSATVSGLLHRPQGREPGVSAQLENARGVIEGNFLAAGDVLSQAVDGIGAMITALDELMETLDPATIRATTLDLSTAGASLLALPGKQATRRATIEHLGQQRVALYGCIFDMRRSLEYMGAFAINIKIAASAIVSADADFGLFAQDISKCIKQGREELDMLFADVAALQRELQKAVTNGTLLERRCEALIPAIPDELDASARVMSDHQQSVAAAAGDAGSLARDVRGKVGQILVALQIGDTTRQRIEHIQAGLGMAAERRAELSAEQTDRVAAHLHALLAAQLAATVEDFGHQAAEINQSMTGLAEDLSKLLRLRDLAYGQGAGEADGFLRKLERRVEQALGLVLEIEGADRVALETGTAVAKAARDLTARVAAIQAVKANVYYMAVNTTLKATRIGEAGRPLSVIAVELHRHSGLLEASAAECLNVLESLAGSAATLLDDPAASGAEDETQAAAKALSAASLRIRAAGDRTEGDITVLAQQGETLQHLLHQPARLSLQSDISAALDEAAATLANLGADAGACDEDVAAPLSGVLARLSALYTMAQERTVHRPFVEGWGIDASEVQPEAMQCEVEDALF